MATAWLALDPITDSGRSLATGNGLIVGMAFSQRALIDKGFAAPNYVNDRVVSIETSAAGWSNDCEPGWFFLNNSAVREFVPLTDLEKLKIALRAAYAQLDAWVVGLNEQAIGQPVERVNTAHDFLWRMRGGMYLIANNSTTYSLAQRIAWANQIPMGAADITSVFAFYTHFSGVATDNWISWVNPVDATRTDLASSIVVPGTFSDSVNLGLPDWIEALTA